MGEGVQRGERQQQAAEVLRCVAVSWLRDREKLRVPR